MTYDELKEYVGIAFELEKNINFQNRVIEHITGRIDAIGKEKQFTPPKKPEFLEIKSDFSFRGESTFEKVYTWILEPLLMGVIMGPFMMFIFTFIFILGGIEPYKEAWFWQWSFALGGFMALCLCFAAIGDSKRKEQKLQNEKAEYFRIKRQYEDELATYNLNVKNEQKRLSECTNYLQLLNHCLVDIKKKKETTVSALSKVYQVGVISPEYRSFIPVASFFQYLNSGRCYSLQGPEGAYNKYEDEKRHDLIITHLSDISGTIHEINQKLTQIRDNQFMLYSAIRENNQNINRIERDISHFPDAISSAASGLSSKLKNMEHIISHIESESALIAYINMQTQREMYYLNRVNYYSGRNDDAGFFYNSPPTL